MTAQIGGTIDYIYMSDKANGLYKIRRTIFDPVVDENKKWYEYEVVKIFKEPEDEGHRICIDYTLYDEEMKRLGMEKVDGEIVENLYGE